MNFHQEKQVDKHVKVHRRGHPVAQGGLPKEADVVGGAEGRVQEHVRREDHPDRRKWRLRVHKPRARHAPVRRSDAKDPQRPAACAKVRDAHLLDREVLGLHQAELQADRVHLLPAFDGTPSGASLKGGFVLGRIFALRHRAHRLHHPVPRHASPATRRLGDDSCAACGVSGCVYLLLQ